MKLDPHAPPRNANNVEPYTFVMLFPRKCDTPHPHLRYVTLEWPDSMKKKLCMQRMQIDTLISNAAYLKKFTIIYQITHFVLKVSLNEECWVLCKIRI